MSNYVENSILEVAHRIREMREIAGYSVEEMAAQTNMTVEMYEKYEAGTTDLPLSLIHI